jgi:hypothetical protein
MPMAQHTLGSYGPLTVRIMFSLEPATVTNRNYPELFQQDETAYGAPIVDGQHPHDLFMELASPNRLQFTALHAPSALHSVCGATPAAEQFFICFRVR